MGVAGEVVGAREWARSRLTLMGSGWERKEYGPSVQYAGEVRVGKRLVRGEAGG